MTLPADDDVSKALAYLATTDEPCAKFAARVKALEHTGKVRKSLAFLEAEGTVAEREAIALTSPDYQAWVSEYSEAMSDYELVKTRRKRAELVVEVWRSIGANRRAGNIT